MSARVFQYGVSGDADVLAALAARIEQRKDFNAGALAWAALRGFEDAYLGLFGNRLSVSGLPGKPEGFGQWKRAGGRERYVPFKNNAAEVKAMQEVGVDLATIPGLPTMLTSITNGRGECYWMQPSPFMHDGRAWFGLGHIPEPTSSRSDAMGEQWAECKASEFYAALEGHNAGRAS